MRAIDIIERAQMYYLLPKDHAVTGVKPMKIGSRLKLEYALDDVYDDMIIATSGNAKKCIILIDYTTHDAWKLANKADLQLIKLKDKN